MKQARASAAEAQGTDPPTLQDAWGEHVHSDTIAATSVKNEFGRVLDSVLQGTIVVITKHDHPKAVLLSLDAYNALASAARPNLDALTQEFDQMLDRMQTTRAKAGMKSAFDAPAKKLGKAAVTAARKRA